MNKAEELINKHIRHYKTLEGEHKGIALHFTNEIEMNKFLSEYAQQVSRERAIKFYNDNTMIKFKKGTDNLYDNWFKSNQEE